MYFQLVTFLFLIFSSGLSAEAPDSPFYGKSHLLDEKYHDEEKVFRGYDIDNVKSGRLCHELNPIDNLLVSEVHWKDGFSQCKTRQVIASSKKGGCQLGKPIYRESSSNACDGILNYRRIGILGSSIWRRCYAVDALTNGRDYKEVVDDSKCEKNKHAIDTANAESSEVYDGRRKTKPQMNQTPEVEVQAPQNSQNR